VSTEKLILSYVTNPNTDTPDTTLNNGGTLTSGATSLTVNTLPAGVSAAQFRIKIDDEILLVTAIGGTGNKTWTVTRGVEGTSAASHVDGSNVYIIPTPGGFLQWLQDTILGSTAPADPGNAASNGSGTEVARANHVHRGGLVLLEQHTASTSASLDFTTCITATYDEYLFELLNLIPATNNVNLWLRMSTDGGATYDSGTNYGWSVNRFSSGGGAFSGGNSGQASIVIDGGGAGDKVSNSSNYGISGSLRLFSPSSTSLYKAASWQTNMFSAASSIQPAYGGGFYLSTTAVNAVRFLFSSGNITSGIVRAFGVMK